MRKLVWGLAMVGLLAGALAFSASRHSDSGGQVLAGLLGENGGEASQPAAVDTSAIIRRLYEGPELDTDGTDISPDGRYLTQTDWDTGDLAVFDLLTGQLRRVTDKGSWEESVAMAEMSVFSPDGTEIAYTWMNEEGWYEVRLIGVDGSNPRVLLGPDPERWTWPGLRDWSPDGQHLLLDLWQKWDSEELTLVSVHDGSLRVLLDLPEPRGVSGVFSPDGRYIAFSQPSRPASPEGVTPDGDVGLIPTLGGDVVPLLRGPADDHLIGWEPDGRGILFKSDRELTEGVWRLQVIDGRPAGEPELIKGDLWRLKSIGVADGRVYYGLATEGPQLYTVGIDLESARILTPPTPVEEMPEGEPLGWAWSPDGRRLAYFRSRDSKDSWVNELVIRSLPGGPARIMPMPIRVVRKISWAPDGRSLVLESLGGAREDPTWTGLYRFDLETGACSPIETAKGIISSATLTQDLKVAYYDGGGWRQEGRPEALWARDLETGEERELTRLSSRNPYRGYPVLSPDERWLARFNLPVDDPSVRAVEIISTESGEVREIHRHDYSGESPGQCGTISWSPDGKYLVYGVANPASGGCTLQRLAVGGGGPTSIGELPSFASDGGFLSPPGTRLAFKHGEWRGEIWVMEYGRGEGR
ncbi:MAG: hypothetical protein ABIF09_03015 [Gemmatimonadota bacterium]